MLNALIVNILSPAHVLVFLLITIRFVGMMMAAQLFRQIPMPPVLRAGLPFLIAIILYPLYGFKQLPVQVDTPWLILMAVQEVLLGAAFGFVVNIFTSTVQFAGQLVSTQMGLDVTEMLDPTTQNRNPITGRLYYLFGAMLFFSLGLHRVLIESVARSFELFPPATFIVTLPNVLGAFTEEVTLLATAMFSSALSLALPVFGALLLVDVALALVAKTVPQMNIFMISMPLKVLLGTGFMFLTLPLLTQGIHQLNTTAVDLLPKLLGAG